MNKIIKKYVCNSTVLKNKCMLPVGLSMVYFNLQRTIEGINYAHPLLYIYMMSSVLLLPYVDILELLACCWC